MSRLTRSCKTHAPTLPQVELHPAVKAPLGKKSSSAYAFMNKINAILRAELNIQELNSMKLVTVDLPLKPVLSRHNIRFYRKKNIIIY
jgi:hypothetical protein